MIEAKKIVKKLSFAELTVELRPVGEDIEILVSGGERPHLGCAVLSVPRESLSGDGSMSCTSSVLNLTGHKDEALCRRLAEAYCKTYGVTTLCAGGFHVDNITSEQLAEIERAVLEILPSPLV